MRTIHFLWLALLLLCSCQYVRQVRLLTGGHVAKETVITMPFELKKDLIVVRAKVNTDGTYRSFIFDTGAFNSKIRASLADSLGLSAIVAKTNHTAQGVSRTIEVTRLDSLRLGSASFQRIGAGMVVYDSLSASPCIASDGIIGANLIQLGHWKVDFMQQQLHFSHEPFLFEPETEVHQVAFKRPLWSGTPSISVEVGGQLVKNVLVDLGYNGGLILPAKWANIFTEPTEQIVVDQSTTGIYGSNVDTLTTKRLAVQIGSYKCEMPVDFSVLDKALLGNEVLKHFTVSFDYDNKQITLEPQAPVEIAPSPVFIPGILNDSLWVVNRTIVGGPLNLGDTLRSINGQQPTDLYTNYCDYFNGIGALLDTDTVSVQRWDGSWLLIEG